MVTHTAVEELLEMVQPVTAQAEEDIVQIRYQATTSEDML
jgi:hypothetical protein